MYVAYTSTAVARVIIELSWHIQHTTSSLNEAHKKGNKGTRFTAAKLPLAVDVEIHTLL